MSKSARFKSARRIIVFALILAVLLYFAPILTCLLLIFGLLDIVRHRRITTQLVQEYFTGKGVLTWLLSPVNLMSDLLARSPRRVESLSDLPAPCRQEIETCVAAFRANGRLITEAIRPHIEAKTRVMLAFKWFGARIATPISIPEFERDFRYVKTIAVSAFKQREYTSWHFGPQRLTLRVLCNLEPLDSPDVYIAVDDKVHYWKDDPLFVFDDTLFHQSVNNAAATRHCLFIDIVRPNYFGPAFAAAIGLMRLIAGSFRSVFYKNWSFVRA